MNKVMKRSFKVIIILVLVLAVSTTIWYSLDEASRCRLIYGRNICNYYTVMDIASGNLSTSDFNTMMELCREMSDVPKKDSCFEVIALTFARIDVDKALVACNEIQEIRDTAGNVVHKRENCRNRIMNITRR